MLNKRVMLRTVGAVVLVGVFLLAVVPALAAEDSMPGTLLAIGGQGRGPGRGGAGAGFVDADGDGICDNCGTGLYGAGAGAGFVDADGDGICDNYGSFARANGAQARGYRYGGGGRAR